MINKKYLIKMLILIHCKNNKNFQAFNFFNKTL